IELNRQQLAFIRTHHTTDGMDTAIAQWMQQNPIETVAPDYARLRSELISTGQWRQGVSGPEAASGDLWRHVPEEERRGAPTTAPAAAGPPTAPSMDIARARLLAARGTPDEARHILFFNRRYNNGQPGMAERILAEQQQDAASGAG